MRLNVSNSRTLFWFLIRQVIVIDGRYVDVRTRHTLQFGVLSLRWVCDCKWAAKDFTLNCYAAVWTVERFSRAHYNVLFSEFEVAYIPWAACIGDPSNDMHRHFHLGNCRADIWKWTAFPLLPWIYKSIYLCSTIGNDCRNSISCKFLLMWSTASHYYGVLPDALGDKFMHPLFRNASQVTGGLSL